MLAKVEVTLPFSAAKLDAIKSARYDSASRLFVETTRRFWFDRQLNGFAFGDDFAEIWDSTFGQPGTHGILQRYLRGGRSLDLVGKSETQRAEESLAKLSTFFPDVRSNFVKSYSKCWSEDPWVMGAWSHLDDRRREAGQAPEAGVHFAGEHLSANSSWMQGALQSGLRAVSEILTERTITSSRV
jgi:monoamine oxidase